MTSPFSLMLYNSTITSLSTQSQLMLMQTLVQEHQLRQRYSHLEMPSLCQLHHL